MTSETLRDVILALDNLLIEHLDRNPGLRPVAEAAGRWLLDAARQSAARTSGPGASPDAQRNETASPAQRSAAAPPAPPVRKESLHLAIGDTRVSVDVHGTDEEIARVRRTATQTESDSSGRREYPPISDADLALVETRCRLKASSCALFIERRKAGWGTDEEREILHRMNGMIAEAKALPNCFLWVFWRDRTPPSDSALVTIGRAYAAHADAAALVRRIVTGLQVSEQTPHLDEAFTLLAATNSALRVALGDTWLTADRDQEEVHHWLRRESAARQIYLERHMRIDDPADPAVLPELQERIRALADRIDGRRSMEKEIRSALKKLQYEANRLVRDADDAEMQQNHLAKMEQVLEELVQLGVPETSRDITDAIGDAAAQALREWPSLNGRLKRALSAPRPAATGGADGPAGSAGAWSQTVRDARALLQGTRAVIIGGEPRSDAAARLEEAFDLAEVEWVELAEHGTGQPMLAPIQRPDTALVIGIVKLAGHLHLEEAREIAAAAGKPCVLLTGGYNPESVAQAVLDQASDRLRARLVEL